MGVVVDGLDRSDGAHVVVDLHDPAWPVIRQPNGVLFLATPPMGRACFDRLAR